MDDAVEVVVCLVGRHSDRWDVMREGGQDDGDETRSERNHRRLNKEKELGDPAEASRLDLLVYEADGQSVRGWAVILTTRLA